MKKLILTLLFGCALIAQNIYSQEQIPDEVLVSYNANKKPLKTVLLDLSLKTEVNIAFQDEILPVDSLISINVRNERLGLVIDDIIKGTGNKYRIVGDQIVIIRDEFKKSKDNITISGYLKDKESGESLIAANVFLYDQSMGTITNEYGFYSFTMPKGVQRLYYSYLGYKMDIKEIRLTKDTTINVNLNPSVRLNEILILDNELLKIEETSASVTDLTLEKINSMVSLAGESDVLSLVNNQAGVNSAADGVGGFSVRGGSVDQNLVLMDGVPIYNPNHALGIFSIFNSNVIKSATLYKSGFPARYGGRLSSVLDVWIRDGNKEKLSGELSTSLLIAKGIIEGPIVKGKSSFLVSFRRTFIDQYADQLSELDFNDRDINFNYVFYDLNAKMNFQLSKKSSIYFSFYQGKDEYDYDRAIQTPGPTSDFLDLDANEWDWGNRMGVVRFSQQLGTKSFLKSSLYYTQYQFTTYDFNKVEESLDSTIINRQFLAGLYSSDISDIGFNLDFDYLPNNVHTLRFGTNLIAHTFKPGVLVANSLDSEFNSLETINIDTLRTRLNTPSIDGNEVQIYFEDNIRPNKHHLINIGFHQSFIFSENKTFVLPQPRLAYLYNKDVFTFKSSISFVSQYLHLITNSGLGVPVDVWLPSTDELAPQTGWVASAGFDITGKSKAYSFGAEAYYKRLNNLLAFNEGGIIDINQEDEWQADVPVGEGESYGIESYFNKNLGKISWDLNYTLSWSFRTFEEINGGRTFPYRFDRRHNLKFRYLHKINENVEFSLAWSYATGNPYTVPFELREVQADDGSIYVLPIYTERNNRRLVDYHRLDLGFNFYSNYSWGNTKFHIGINNLYGRVNPFAVDLIKVSNDPIDFKFQDYSLPQFLPSVSYSVSF